MGAEQFLYVNYVLQYVNGHADGRFLVGLFPVLCHFIGLLKVIWRQVSLFKAITERLEKPYWLCFH